MKVGRKSTGSSDGVQFDIRTDLPHRISNENERASLLHATMEAPYCYRSRAVRWFMAPVHDKWVSLAIVCLMVGALAGAAALVKVPKIHRPSSQICEALGAASVGVAFIYVLKCIIQSGRNCAQGSRLQVLLSSFALLSGAAAAALAFKDKLRLSE